jgi:hypothetical protein
MRDEERIAQALLEGATGARLIYNQSQSHGEPDFFLHRADGGPEPVEVTRSTDQHLQLQYARIKQGHFVRRTKTSHDWLVEPYPDADIQRIRENVDAYVADIEAEGLSRFFFPIDAAHHLSVQRISRELRLEAGQAVTFKTPGIGIGLPAAGGKVLADHVVAAVEHEARKPDNIRKLVKLDANRRHLVVVLDPLDDQSEDREAQPLGAMRHGLLPDRPPTLPAGITDAWVIGSDYSSDRYKLWHATGVDWQDLGDWKFE